MFRTLSIATILAGIVSSAAIAGPQYIDSSEYAAGGYDVVAFRSLKQSRVGEQQPEAIPGKTSITAEYNGSTWAFSTEENRDMFVASPEKFVPQFDGHCAYGIAQGGKVPGNPNLWRIVEDKLYFNITPVVVGFWEADIDGLLDTAGSNWGSLESNQASTRSWKAINQNDGTYSVEAPLN